MKNIIYKLKKKVLLLRRELIAYYCHYFKQKSENQVKVVIFAQGRTGSTLLEDLLSKAGDFQSYGELFHKSRGEILYPLHFIRGLPKRKPDVHFIFHVKIYQLTRDRKRPVDVSDFLETLYDEGWKIIFLRRRNKVKHVLSNYVLKARGTGHKYDNKQEIFRVQVDTKKFIPWVYQRIRFEEAEKKVLQHVGYHEVVYEDDLESQDKHQETVNNIFDYLSLERKEVSTRHKKVNTVPLDELIINYDQFEKRIIQEGWGEFLD